MTVTQMGYCFDVSRIPASAAMPVPLHVPSGHPISRQAPSCANAVFCVARVVRGLELACVRTYPTKPLGFGPMEKLKDEKAKKASALISKAAWQAL